MYCQSCGTEIQEGLSYCNRCGAQVVGLAPARDERVVFVPTDVTGPVRTLSATICLTMVFSLIALFATIGNLVGRGVTTAPIVVIAVIGLTGIFATELSLIRMLSRLLFEAREQKLLAAARSPDASELRPAAAQHLFQPATTTGPVHSVTDHTTRTLGHAYQEPRG